MRHFLFQPSVLYCLAVASSIACGRLHSNIDKSVSSTNNSLTIDSIANLPEIKSVFEQLNRRFPESRSTMLVQSEPSPDSPYYWVQLGFMTDERFVPYLNFYVDNNRQVLFVDTVKDTLVSFQFFESQLLSSFLN